MARRTKGEGTLRQRKDSRWEARVTIDGRQRSFFAPTQTEALKKMRAAQRLRETGRPAPDAKTTVGDYLESWANGKRANLRPHVAKQYAARIRRLNREIGHVKLARLQPEHIEDALASIGETVTGTTLQHYHALLQAALDAAEQRGKVARNVCRLVERPKRTTREFRSLSPQDARDLLEAAKADTYIGPVTILALTSGLREGEIMALDWKDIDLDRRRINVRRTLQPDGSLTGSSREKNHSRVVWLSAAALEALQALPHREGFVFGVNRPLAGTTLRKRFKALLSEAGLPPVTFHELRHSAASLLLSEGVPVKVVSELLGHADTTTTLRVYAHIIDGHQEQAASAMDRILHG